MEDKEFYTTPIQIRIISANHMIKEVAGHGYAKNQFSGDDFKKQFIIGWGAWYADKIGEEWSVIPFNLWFYRVNNAAGCGFFFINKSDAEVI